MTAALVLLAVVCATLGLPPRIDGDLLNRVPADQPAVVALQALRSGSGGDGLVLVSLPEDADAPALAEAMLASSTVRDVFYQLDDDLAARLAALRYAPQDVRDLTVRIQAALAVPSPLVQARLLAGEVLPEPPALHLPDGVVVIPSGPSSDPVFCEALLSDLETAAPGNLGIDGSHIAVARTGREVEADLRRTAGVSLAMVIGVLAIMLRSARALVALLPPLLLAVTTSLALVQLIHGALNTYTSMGTAILFGLGIDFGIHLMARYRELRGDNRAPEAAAIEAWDEVGPPCVIAALTSAAGFAALMLADFRGISQLGGALALGVLICLAFMLLLLPILLVRLDPGPIAVPAGTTSTPRLGGLLAFGLVVTVLAGALWPQLSVEYDTSAMRQEGFAWAELSEADRTLREQSFSPVIVSVADAEARTAEHTRLQSAVDAGLLPHIRAVLSVDSILPADQTDRLEALSALARIGDDPRAATLPGAVRAVLTDLRAVTLEPLEEDELPQALKILLGVGDPRVLLLPQGNMRDLRVSHELAGELDGVVENAASEFLTHGTLYDLITRDLVRFALAALGAVMVILSLDLRRPRLVLTAAAGLLGGIAWAGGGMAIADIRINIANIVALPILLGIGVDVVIHLLHRLETTRDVGLALRTSGYAALTSTVTTLAAFAALLTAGNRGIQSTGEVIAMGLTLVFLAAVVLVPAGWSVTARSR